MTPDNIADALRLVGVTALLSSLIIGMSDASGKASDYFRGVSHNGILLGGAAFIFGWAIWVALHVSIA